MSFPHETEPGGVHDKYLVFKHPQVDFASVSAHALVQGEDADQVMTLPMVDSFVFVLRPDRDYHARVALAAYAESVRLWNLALSEDLVQILDDVRDQAPRLEPT